MNEWVHKTKAKFSREQASYDDVLGSGHVQRSPAEAGGERAEPALAHLGEEQVVLVCEPLVVPTDLPDHAVLSRAVRALRLVLRQASAQGRPVSALAVRDRGKGTHRWW